MANFKEAIADVEAFVFDVDGVMTDGGIIPTHDGDFIRRYDAKDGYALAYAVKIGYKVCIISGGRGRTLENRLRMLGIREYHLDCMDKIATLRDFFAREGLDPQRVVYMGDDIPDLECMREVGIPVCPADAAAEVVEAASDEGADGGSRELLPASDGPSLGPARRANETRRRDDPTAKHTRRETISAAKQPRPRNAPAARTPPARKKGFPSSGNPFFASARRARYFITGLMSLMRSCVVTVPR